LNAKRSGESKLSYHGNAKLLSFCFFLLKSFFLHRNAQAGQKRAEEKAEAASGRARVASVQLEQAKVTLTELRAKIEQLESSMREAQSRRNALVKTQTARLAERSRESRRIRELEEEVLSAKSIAAKEARALKAEVANARRCSTAANV
jgi:hypothetical protein